MNKIMIIDFGSQVTQLIARRTRELGFYSEIVSYKVDLNKLKDTNIKAIILSGGPASVSEKGSPQISKEIFDLGKPILGICYGLQLICHYLGGRVEPDNRREYGKATITNLKEHALLKDVKDNSTVWMSHGDKVLAIPDGFKTIGSTASTEFCIISNDEGQIYGVQYHPEVTHTEYGKEIYKNFLIDICKLQPEWTATSFVEQAITRVKDEVGSKSVLCGLSGGVDSSVTAAIIHKAIGDRLQCVFVDTGLLRKNERVQVEEAFRLNYPNIKLHVEDATDLFYRELTGVSDPELKRKTIGRLFIEVFESCAKKLGQFDYLAQGTLYPDVIESVSVHGDAAVTIKSHHNVGGLPERLNFKLIEPLREMFKDEVRAAGRLLGLPVDFIGRHPFPGPGLAIRILGELSKEKIILLQEADSIYIDELRKSGQYDKIWQAFCVLLPVKSVGVMGDGRTYEYTCAIRAVTSNDGMTADWYPMPYDILASISNRIINEAKGFNRVVYDISSKPPATIEWE